MVSLQNRKFEKDAERVKLETRDGSLHFPSIFRANSSLYIHTSPHSKGLDFHLLESTQTLSLTFSHFLSNFFILQTPNLSILSSSSLNFVSLVKVNKDTHRSSIIIKSWILILSLFSKKRYNQVSMVKPNTCIIINMQVHIRNLQVQVINFHQRIMQFRGEMKEKDEDQDSTCITSIFHQDVENLPRYMVREFGIASRRRKGSRMDQKWKQDLLVRVFRRKRCNFPVEGG